jgi:hypothetical protein
VSGLRPAARDGRAGRGDGGARCDRGEALLFAVFALLLLGISLALLGLTMRMRLEERQRELRSTHLELLLDGAVAETLARLAIDPRFGGLAPRGDGSSGGEGWTEVERVGLEHARIEAGARLGPRRVHGRALVWLGGGVPRVESWLRGPEP